MELKTSVLLLRSALLKGMSKECQGKYGETRKTRKKAIVFNSFNSFNSPKTIKK